jgi:hypothetical protein
MSAHGATTTFPEDADSARWEIISYSRCSPMPSFCRQSTGDWSPGVATLALTNSRQMAFCPVHKSNLTRFRRKAPPVPTGAQNGRKSRAAFEKSANALFFEKIFSSGFRRTE